MPYSKLSDVPPQIKTHQGIPLNLPQANKWASIYDAVKGNPDLENPAAIAWSQWEKIYAKEDEKWVTRTGDGKISDVVVNIFEDYKPEGEEFIWAAFRKSECTGGWYFSTILLIDEPTEEVLGDVLWEGEYKLYKMNPTFAEVADSLHGFIDELPEADMEFSITSEITVEQTKTISKRPRKRLTEEVVFVADFIQSIKQDSGTDNLVVHGVAVSLKVSNGHRFPEDVLERDIGTLIGQPIVEGHSMWPMDVEVKDMYGMVVDAWYNRAEKRAEFYAEVWDENYKTVLDKMPHRVKFSVGFSHDFDVEEKTEIQVSSEVFFDHIGTTNRPADTDSVLLGIKQDAEARGRCVRLEGKRAIVAEPSTKVDAKGGNNMPDENTGEPEPETPPVPPVEEPETPPAGGTEGGEPETPPAEPPAPDNESADAGDDEPAEGKTAAMGKKLEEMNTAFKSEQEKRKELEKTVDAFVQAEKRRTVETYVNTLIAEKIKAPSQKDSLVEQYLTFNEVQMKRELELNQVSADLSGLFGEKAVVSEPDDEDDKVPDRKTIT